MTTVIESKTESTSQNWDSRAKLCNKTLIAEHKELKELICKQYFHHLNDRQCLVTIKKTKYRCLKLKIDIFANYPESNDSLMIEIISQYLPNRLIKQLYKGIDKLQQMNQCKPRIVLIIKSLHDIIMNNKLTYAFDEVRKMKKMFENKKNIKLKVHETKGKIDFELMNNDYKSRFVLNVPDLYPLEPVLFKIKKCSFPVRYQRIYSEIANNLCGKLSKGFDIDYILNTRKFELKEDISSLERMDFNSNTALEIRSDLKTMHKMSLFHNKLMDSKGVRRKVRVMNKKAKAEEAKEDAMRKEMERACIDPNKCVNEAKASLLICIEYLVKQFTKLPMEICKLCNKNIFPKNAKILHEWEHIDNRKKYMNKGKYPQRSDCGHWFHHECLDKYLSLPPFGKKCPTCDEQLNHHLFESDIKTLERQWAVKQAKERELDDIDQFVSDMFD